MATPNSTHTTADQRFWDKIDRGNPDECWPWTGYIDPDTGYGQSWDPDRKRLTKAHRRAFELAIGPIPEGHVSDHACHNGSGCTDVPCRHRRCCNPAHLEAITQSENSIRGRSGNHQMAKTHCRNGHEYAGDNVIMRQNKNGRPKRVCRICITASQARYNAKRYSHINTDT